MGAVLFYEVGGEFFGEGAVFSSQISPPGRLHFTKAATFAGGRSYFITPADTLSECTACRQLSTISVSSSATMFTRSTQLCLQCLYTSAIHIYTEQSTQFSWKCTFLSMCIMTMTFSPRTPHGVKEGKGQGGLAICHQYGNALRYQVQEEVSMKPTINCDVHSGP